MGTWYDDEGNVYSAMAEIQQDQFRERFRCMVCIGSRAASFQQPLLSVSWRICLYVRNFDG